VLPEEALASLFSGRVELGAVIEAVVEGRLGRATVAGAAARLSVGCYEIFGGDASSPAARTLVAGGARPRELVYGNDALWRRLILDVYGDEVFDRPMLDYDPGGIDRASLLAFEARLPRGFSLQALDAGLTAHSSMRISSRTRCRSSPARRTSWSTASASAPSRAAAWPAPRPPTPDPRARSRSRSRPVPPSGGSGWRPSPRRD
jgi:hypothetical protein